MCGIVGYIGQKPAAEVILGGLQALEYRGYDSAGMALIHDTKGMLHKQVGRVEGLRSLVSEQSDSAASLAIGHTRWATHGSPTILNAHPHHNTDETIFVVHNGIIENYAELREELQKEGYEFVSQTDTEVVPHLIDFYYKKSGDFELAFKETLGDLRGAYAIAVVTTEALIRCLPLSFPARWSSVSTTANSSWHLTRPQSSNTPRRSSTCRTMTSSS
jgi:glucosamine--fructose-6-phosphate aminotransferase (isomerizing)